MRIRKNHLAVLVCTAAMATSACSVSFDPSNPNDPYVRPIKGPALLAQSGTMPQGSGNVNVVVLGQELPASVLEDFHQATGFTVTQSVVGDGTASTSHQDEDGVAESGPQSTPGSGNETAMSEALSQALAQGDVIVGADSVDLRDLGLSADSSQGSTQTIGRNDVCVMADQQWFSVNKQQVPASWEDIAATGKDLLIPSSDTPTGRFFDVAIQHLDPTWLDTVVNNGAMRTSDDGWAQFSGFAAVAAHGEAESSPSQVASAPTTDQRPLIISAQSLAVHVMTNTGAESAATPIASTCLKRELYAVTSAEGQASPAASALMTYLTSTQGQQALSDAGVVYPNDPNGIHDAMTQLAVPAENATEVDVQ